MSETVPLLPTSVIGSYAWPAWLHTALEASQRGEYGSDDMREAQDDAVDLALRDQEQAGVDIVSDGEMRRAGFFTAAFYGHMTGLSELPPQRQVGIAGHDQRESYLAVEPIAAPKGLGLLDEYRYASRARVVRSKCPAPAPTHWQGGSSPAQSTAIGWKSRRRWPRSSMPS